MNLDELSRKCAALRRAHSKDVRAMEKRRLRDLKRAGKNGASNERILAILSQYDLESRMRQNEVNSLASNLWKRYNAQLEKKTK